MHGDRRRAVRCNETACRILLTLLSAVVLLSVRASSQIHLQRPRGPVSPSTRAFIENIGQWHGEASFVGTSHGATVRLNSGGLDLLLSRRSPDGSADDGLRLTLGREGTACSWEGEHPLPGPVNFLVGNRPSEWRVGARRFGGARTRSGIEIESRFTTEGLALRICWPAEGDQRLTLRSPNDTGWGESTATSATLDLPGWGVRLDLEAGSTGRLQAFHDRIVITPSPGEAAADSTEVHLSWLTYFGGDSGGEYVYALDVDAAGRVIAVGETRSLDLPVSPGAFDPSWNGGCCSFPSDAFVSCLSPDGTTLIYSTYLGGALSNEHPSGVVVAEDGDVIRPGDDAIPAIGDAIVAGWTGSADFPTTRGAFDTTTENSDAFVTRLSAGGTQLVYSTMLGGSGGELGYGLVVDGDGRAMVTGQTTSDDFPVTPDAVMPVAADPGSASPTDSFLAVLNATGTSLVYSTYVQGTETDQALALALIDSHRVAICGTTLSPDFPVTPGAFDVVPPVPPFDPKGFALVLDIDASKILYSTFVNLQPLRVKALVDGSLIVAGVTGSATDPPVTPGAFDTTPSGADSFLLRLSPTLDDVVFGTYFGASQQDTVADLQVDSAGRPILAGWTFSSDLPTTEGSAFPVKPIGPTDGFIARFSAAGDKLLYSTFIGGPGGDGDNAVALALDHLGRAVFGLASDGGLPVTPGAFDTTEPGIFDAGIGVLELLPTGVESHGQSTGGTQGAVIAEVSTMPKVGESGFALTCLNAPARQTGLLALGTAPANLAIPVKGIELWLEPSRIALLLPAASDGVGYAEVPAPLPASPQLVGQVTWWQFFWPGPAGAGPWSASNALKITLQP